MPAATPAGSIMSPGWQPWRRIADHHQEHLEAMSADLADVLGLLGLTGHTGLRSAATPDNVAAFPAAPWGGIVEGELVHATADEPGGPARWSYVLGTKSSLAGVAARLSATLRAAGLAMPSV